MCKFIIFLNKSFKKHFFQSYFVFCVGLFILIFDIIKTKKGEDELKAIIIQHNLDLVIT